MTKIADIRRSVRLKAVDKQIVKLELELKETRKLRAELLASQKLACPSCGKKHPVSALMLIAGMRYHKSWSSYEDSSWDADETYYTVCPSCSSLVEFIDLDWIADFKKFFKEAKEGRLQYRKSDDKHMDRKGKISVMSEDDTYGCSSYSYKEVLVPYAAIAKAVNGRIDRFSMYR